MSKRGIRTRRRSFAHSMCTAAFLRLPLLHFFVLIWRTTTASSSIPGLSASLQPSPSSCTRSDCSGHGNCLGTSQKPICFCDQGYSGHRCEMELCSHVAGICNGHGLCLGTSSTHLCLCEPGYSGKECEQENNNSNGGDTNPLRMPSLRMPIKAFSPSEASTKSLPPTLPSTCSPSQCHDRGICLSIGTNDQPPICICQLGFNGLRCENDLFKKTVDLLQSEGLFGNQSLANSTSSISANASALCSPKECNNQGICLGTKAKPRCICNLGHGGQKCESAIFPSMCSTEHCLGRGICLGTTHWHTCSCQPGWTGRRCEERMTEKKLRMYWTKFYQPNRQ